MNKPRRFFSTLVNVLLSLVLFFAWSGIDVNAEPTVGAAASLRSVCLPDQPVVQAGKSVTLRVWATDADGAVITRPIRLTWAASIGRIVGDQIATWSFESGADGSAEVIKAHAVVTIDDEMLGRAVCDLSVYLSKSNNSLGLSGANRSPMLSDRAFLLHSSDPPRGYGLYSYLLFYAPPGSDEERQRYLSAIEAYLLILQPLEEMERYRRRSELDIILLPLKSNVEIPADLSNQDQLTHMAERVLAAYDYARAKVLLFEFGKASSTTGPYLVSKIADEGNSSAAGSLLSFDMSHVVPKLVHNWVRTFCSLTAQEHSWSDVVLAKIALDTRNVIAVGANETPQIVTSLKNWIQLVKAQ
ncbi:hypothetical protein B0G80_9153 [Paraburkholderia sp. BL6669N2]|uniref:hypothetical protein n=1 Tax=Paraburkholderia sp. BL6669N2 TaxID=1938807 RepID=UPI000E270520|nr:hypothetical protein [Paraburkholderia sp. BL6669N2]REG45545.1 hypothetical protein B0G80_9153 [Paraburkholderia sp. BL6669N2]